jgi:outer membrane lipoprotein-sorting protein
MSLQSLSRVFLAILTALCPLSGMNVAYADNFDIARLMQLLSQAPESEMTYTEKKYSSLLVEPVVSSGTLAYRRPDTVEKNMTAPRKERFRIAGEELITVRNGAEKRFPLSSQPLLSAFAASLRGVLAGDEVLLRKHYRLTLEGQEQAWRLELVPLDEEITRYVERILVSGRTGRIEQIEVRESSSDRSVLQVR